MSIVVGVDAGGSSIGGVMERDGERREFHGEAANIRTLGVERAAERIVIAVSGAADGAAPDKLAVGAAGAGDPDVALELDRVLRAAFPYAAIAVVDDAEIALRAGVPEGDGAVLIAGTGSIAYARVGDAVYRSGGYGYLLGDDGSGFAVGRAALMQLLRSYDGRTPREGLFDEIEARFDARDARSLLASVYGNRDAVAAIASIAPVVLERASAGERLATKIVQAAALELVDLVKALVRRANAGSRDLPLVYAGGLLSANTLLSFLIETRLAADLPLLVPVKSAPAPMYGALDLARALRG